MMRAALLAVAVALFASPARADPWAGVDVLEDGEMADLRGGFVLPNGVAVNFAATVSTYANDALALQTELTLSDSGFHMEQLVGELGVPLQSLTIEEREALGLVGLGDNGIVIVDGEGVTALVQNVGTGGLHNIVFNTGSGRDLRQVIDVTITLPGFLETQNAIGAEIVGIRIGADLSDMLAWGG